MSLRDRKPKQLNALEETGKTVRVVPLIKLINIY